jgi:hypothetical protein
LRVRGDDGHLTWRNLLLQMGFQSEATA